MTGRVHVRVRRPPFECVNHCPTAASRSAAGVVVQDCLVVVCALVVVLHSCYTGRGAGMPRSFFVNERRERGSNPRATGHVATSVYQAVTLHSVTPP